MTDVGAVDEDARAEFHEACVFDCVVLSPEPTRRALERPEGSGSPREPAPRMQKYTERQISDFMIYRRRRSHPSLGLGRARQPVASGLARPLLLHPGPVGRRACRSAHTHATWTTASPASRSQRSATSRLCTLRTSPRASRRTAPASSSQSTGDHWLGLAIVCVIVCAADGGAGCVAPPSIENWRLWTREARREVCNDMIAS